VNRNRDVLIDAALQLAWSHWVGLGVRGTAHPPRTAVDPEALLYLTACLADDDPRLADEVRDWWRQYNRYVSRPRLTALGKRFDAAVVEKFRAFSQRSEQGGKTSGKSLMDRLNHPARSLLRLRCVFGANARAEVLLELLTRPSPGGFTALALADVGYSKRNIALVLEDLALADMLLAKREANRLRYRIADADALERLLAPLPKTAGLWHIKLPVVARFVELSRRLRGRDAVVQGIEARKVVHEIQNTPAAETFAEVPTASAETYWNALQEWLVDNVIASESNMIASESNIEDPRMIEGAFFRPEQPVRRPGHFVSALLPRISSNPSDDAELHCLDLVQVEAVETGSWVWGVVSVAAVETYAHTMALQRGEAQRFVTWAFGPPRTYSVALGQPLPYAQIARLYGEGAASRARRDKDAIQLHLVRVKGESGHARRASGAR
jgi:hypothetical protein